ncbi:T9SS type A sorting domain-containing protein [Hymenobacter elongatus]|uniref:T9SS type A sorting domain-containing protein n=1 Tax=Hymenobacter elongatus TaxID=877208 RepID=A0A4Z0PM92_9BACT|nr:T9SS type A sorting domain-containing protein [Hymenobacter elongatus]TGE16588.1 T9SS type A sorting domain-containing protein [Hymenobacter elongatus]
MKITATVWWQVAVVACLACGSFSVTQAQTLDPTFQPTVLKNPITTADFLTRALVVQPDGKVVVSGAYDYLDGVITSTVRRLNADGSPDAAFLAKTGLGPDVNFAQALALQSDGKILAGGAFAHYNGVVTGSLARLNADGSVDKGFNAGGTGFFGGAGGSVIRSLTVQPDGKILVGGGLTDYNGTAVGSVLRLNPDGTLDPSFALGAGGITNGASLGRVDALQVQADGKIVVGGLFSSVAGTIVGNVVRLNANGSLDNTFAVGSGFNNQVRALAQQPDGKLLVGGLFTQLNGQASPSLIRLNLNGTVDNTFLGATLSTGGGVYRVRLRADGSLLVAGQFTSYNGVARGSIARLSANGTLDTGFAPGAGATVGSTANLVYDVADIAGGQLLAGGPFLSFDNTVRTGLVRLTSIGTLDGTYNPVYEKRGTVERVTPLADGRLVVQGNFTSFNGTTVTNGRPHLLNADGSYNSTINTAVLGSQFVQPDGRIYVVGSTGTNTGTIRRLLPGGSLDASFSVVNLTSAFGNIITTNVRELANGQVLIYGFFDTVNGQARARLARLTASGALDASFVLTTTPWETNPPSNVFPVVDGVQENGQILVRWFDTNRAYLTRLNTDGSTDNSFSLGSAGGPTSFFTAYVLRGGKLLVSGNFTSFNGQAAPNGLARLNANGSPDATFTAAKEAANSGVVLQPDSRILLLKRVLANNTTELSRLNADGSLDATFQTVQVPGGYFSGTGVNGIVLQPQDGKILLFGPFTRVNGQQRVGLARLTNSLLTSNRSMAAVPVLQVFPNPAHSAATLQTDSGPTAREAQLLDQLGRPVRTFQVPARATSATLNVQGLPAGLYLLRCQGATHKLIVE